MHYNLIYQKILIFSLCTAAFMIPFSIALTNIAIVAAIIAVVVYKIITRSISVNFAGIGYLLAGFLIIALLSIFNATDKTAGLNGIRKSLKYFSIILALGEITDKKNTMKWILYCLLAAAFSVSLNGIFQYFSGFDLLKHNLLTYTLQTKRITASMHNPNDLAVFLASCIGIYFAVLYFSDKNRKFLYIPLIVCMIASLMTFSRGLILFYFLLISALSLIKKDLRPFAIFIIIVILLFAILPAGMAGWLKENPNPINFFIDHSRYLHWSAAINMFKAHPFIGAGVNNFVPSYIIYRSPEDGFERWYAHNLYLHMLGEIGLLGFGLFTAMIFYGFKRCVKKLRKTTEENRWVYYACLFSVSAFLITGIFESNLYYSNLAVFFWILFSVMLFSPLEPESA